MKKHGKKLNPFISLIMLAAISSFTTGNAYAGKSCDGSHAKKQVICHIPPGNPDNMHSIEVGSPAINAHLAHGDDLGYCLGQDTVTDLSEEADESSSTAAAPVLRVYSMRSIHGI